MPRIPRRKRLTRRAGWWKDSAKQSAQKSAANAIPGVNTVPAENAAPTIVNPINEHPANHPPMNHPTINHHPINHPSLNHPSINHSTLNHPSMSHPSMDHHQHMNHPANHLGSHPIINHPHLIYPAPSHPMTHHHLTPYPVHHQVNHESDNPANEDYLQNAGELMQHLKKHLRKPCGNQMQCPEGGQ